MVFSNKYKPVIYTGSGSQNGLSRRYYIAVLKFSIILTLFYLSPVISTYIYSTHRLRSKLQILLVSATQSKHTCHILGDRRHTRTCQYCGFLQPDDLRRRSIIKMRKASVCISIILPLIPCINPPHTNASTSAR